MDKNKIELLGEYIKNTNYPILIDEIPESIRQKVAVIINSDCKNDELTGKYIGKEFEEPNWYKKLKTIDKNTFSILIIDQINNISEQEQRKFIELLKYRKSYIYKLPENCKIFVTYSKDKEKPIEKEVYSFLIHI